MNALQDRIEPIQPGMISALDAQGETASQQVNAIMVGREWDAGLRHSSEVGGFQFLFGSAGLQTEALPLDAIDNRSIEVQIGRSFGAQQTSTASLAGSGPLYGIVAQQQGGGELSRETGTIGGEFNGTMIGPVRALLAVFQRWDISDELAARVLGASGSEYIANLRSGVGALKTRDEWDRARLLIDIYEGVFSLLQDPDSEKAWIRIPRADFNGQSVLEMMTEGSQRNLIRVQAFVDYVNGR